MNRDSERVVIVRVLETVEPTTPEGVKFGGFQ